MAKQVWKWQPTDKWVRVVFNDVTVADSTSANLMIESRGELDYYFPLADVNQDALVPSEHTEKSGYRGIKRFWHLKVGDKIAENAAWTYDPKDKRPDFTGYIAFDWHKMDHWYEESEEVFHHARHPYHRVDFVPSTRRVEIFVDGVKVADSTRPLMVFETELNTRYYLPDEDVNFDYLTPVDTVTYCPYKGASNYYDVVVNGETYANTAWYYPEPLPEAPRLKGTIAFWPEKDKRIKLVVDGVEK